MRSSSRIVSRCFLACISFSACTGVVPAQQVTLGAPAIGLGDSFREGISTNLAFSQGSPNGLFFFRSGGLPPALGATTFGIGQSRGGRSWRLGISVMQGSDRNFIVGYTVAYPFQRRPGLHQQQHTASICLRLYAGGWSGLSANPRTSGVPGPISPRGRAGTRSASTFGRSRV